MNCCNALGQCTRGPDCPARPPAQSIVRDALAYEREQWTGPTVERSCDELAVCHSVEPPCRDCHPVSEGTRSSQLIWEALKDIPLSFPRAK